MSINSVLRHKYFETKGPTMNGYSLVLPHTENNF